MFRPLFFVFIAVFLWCSCGPKGTETSKKTWRGCLLLSARDTLPFTFDIVSDSEWHIHNGLETIKVTDIRQVGDSLFVRMPVYDSEFRLKHWGSELTGFWYNRAKSDTYAIPFRALPGRAYRFARSETAGVTESQRWAVTFVDDGGEDQAIGQFEFDGSIARGTFLTPTGDYRYLAGAVNREGESIHRVRLSVFDGSHAFLFDAAAGQDTLRGFFRSGTHYLAKWWAVRDEAAFLPDPDTLTWLNDGYDRLDIRLPDLNGDTITLDDPEFAGKPVVVQIMGSWCPNCLDETRFLADWYAQQDDVAVLAIAFERSPKLETAKKALERLQNEVEMTYPIAFGGYARKSEAAKVLPALNHIMSYPTTIFIRADRSVSRIHTGFSGPATGQAYEDFKISFAQSIRELTANNAP